jgi:ribosomal peptide maturation radical SAM protein 1
VSGQADHNAATPRVLLVSMPCIHPSNTSLALALLSQILERDNLPTDCLYGPLHYPRNKRWDSEEAVRFLISYAGFLFGAHLASDREAHQAALYDFLCQDFINELTLHGLRPMEGDRERIFRRIRRRINDESINAAICLDRCVAAASQPSYDVVGFSITFFTQLPASLVLAQRLKAQRPGLKIMFGGAGCLDAQADGLMRSFPVIDAVAYTEADDVIAPLVRALRGEGALADVPGIVHRADGALARTPPPPLRRDLDALPLPDHDAYFRQQRTSDWRDVPPVLFFETSRGCWWGQKHLCTFCGLSERELAFRSKSPERVYEEVTHLYQRYDHFLYLHPTDDILDTRYFATLLPRLAAMPRLDGRPLRLFFEVKSNMRPEHLYLLAQAGVGAVQPGIESFSDHVLQLMDKGATGLDQVQFVKWATQAGVQLVYNMLIRNPGETAADYREMAQLVPSLMHLPPPSAVLLTELERFSPYFRRAAAFGIQNIRPKDYYRLLFPVAGVDLESLAYRFDYDHPLKHDAELLAAQREFVARIDAWCRDYRPWQLYYQDEREELTIVDARHGQRRTTCLRGPAAELFRYLDRQRPFTLVRRRFHELDEAMLRAKLAEWHARGLIYSSPGDHHLALVPRKFDAPPKITAPLEPLPTSAEPLHLTVL